MIGILTLALIVAQIASDAPEPAEPLAKQSTYDADATKMASGMTGSFRSEKGEPLFSRAPVLDERRHPWHPVTDAEMRSATGYWAPVGYRFHREIRVDLDRDGVADTVQMVQNDRQRALMVVYGDKTKAARVFFRSRGAWSDQALMAAGKDGLMVNFPETSVVFIFQRKDAFMERVLGD